MDIKIGLHKVRDLLSDVNNWTKGYNAVDNRGQPTERGSANACKWCLMGAVEHCVRDMYLRDKIESLIRICLPGKYRQSLSAFNDDDDTTHADVIRVINNCIVKL